MLIVPIGHDKSIYGLPVFTVAVVGLCTAIQVLDTTLWLSGSSANLIDGFGYRPSDGVSTGLITSQFVHGGYLHLIGNMIFLWLTGANMEYRWGWKAWAAVYLVGGAVAAATYAALHPGGTIPLVGASGAIAAAMGAFMVCLYNARIRFWYAYWFVVRFRSGQFVAPAYVALPLWFAGELFSTYFYESEAAGGGVAYSAHVGGFVFGAAVALVLRLTGYEDKLRAAAGSDVFDEDGEFAKAAVPLKAEGRYAGAQRFAAPPVASATAARIGATPLGAMQGGSSLPYVPGPTERTLSSRPPPRALNPLLGSEPPTASLPPDGAPLDVDFGMELELDEPSHASRAARLSSRPAGPLSVAPGMYSWNAADVAALPPDWKRFEEALEQRDAAGVAREGSKYLEEAARSRPGEVVGLFRRIQSQFPDTIPLGERGLAIAARFAAHADDADLTLAATRALIVQYPRSKHTPGAMVEAARLQQKRGWHDKARVTLQNVIRSYPDSDEAARARRALER